MSIVVTFAGRTPLPTAGSWYQIWSYRVQPSGPADLRPGQRIALALPSDVDLRDPALFPGVPALDGAFIEADPGSGRQYAGRTVTSTGPLVLSFVAPPTESDRDLLLVTRTPGQPWTVTPFATTAGGPTGPVRVLTAPVPGPVRTGRPVGEFAGTLPYASELFGVYQPLPGWLGYSGAGRLAALHGPRPGPAAFAGPAARSLESPELAALARFAGQDPPTEGILSPVGLVNLFRQYFFEFDTFLGAPAGHLWLSPGGMVELVETTTRRTLVERTASQSEETTRRSEETLTDQSDVADAVKESNANDTSLGATVSAGGSFAGVYHADASASFATKSTTGKSSELTHKHTRTQSSKVSSEIRRNFTTTFKTVTETTDTSSRRYVVQNTTDRLANYELRRKMRKVGVQVQHIGTRMSWQVFVNAPGRVLGLGEFVDVVPAPDLTSLRKPEPPEPLTPILTTFTGTFPIQEHPDSTNAPHNDADWRRQDGFDRMWRGEEDEYIVADFDYGAIPPAPGFTLSTNPDFVQFVSAKNGHGTDAKFLVRYVIQRPDTGRFQVRADNVHFGGTATITFTLQLRWEPPAVDPAQVAYEAALRQYEKDVAALQRKAYAAAVRDRTTLLSKVRPRPAEELRKEERHSVFAHLLEQLRLFDPRDAHLEAELIRQIFDVDEMLYFVSPEFWRPGDVSGPAGPDSLGRYPVPPARWEGSDGDPLAGETVPTAYSRTSSHNGPDAKGPDPAKEWRVDYLITADSQPAPMGSSLGWLVQTDGDERRNEFLNSAWVKAVLPIRPGHEREALGWLTKAGVEGEAALGRPYTWQEGDPDTYRGKSIGEVLELLAAELAASNTSVPRTLAGEQVFETGFDPLAGGFRPAEPYQVFDQWVEVLPTDQVVAVEVAYDPKTGQQL
ncbi:hypothetical protein [Streptomyces showdoensis]|uniref:Uncharacterized protein n=1 Tax=Streptomyces showdoensis TaxID=68268 RepID=A0A2P2GJV8_STREW|nr:hypothetical protein [Streptomyces showdoensis]KKZ71777.1 hypothetical protein VO63_21825 [Streptomyces showdoensis]